MSKIRIKNFGPIKDGFHDESGNEWIDIKKVTVFIGNQGSGKSTVAKLISIMTWLEKAHNRGDEIRPMSKDRFLELFEYQGIQNYFSNDTIIQYKGDAYDIDVERDGFFTFFEKRGGQYIVPKIMYVPAERNFLSIVKNAFNVKGLPSSLFTFAEELRRAQKELSGETIRLPINDYSYNYDETTETSILKGVNHEINLLEASSGLQSSVPLFLVSRNLAHLINNRDVNRLDDKSVSQSVRMLDELLSVLENKSLSKNETVDLIARIRAKYQNSCFINIVEEPEQNLFPTSQLQMLQKLLEYNNMTDGNKLIMTTHSPYIINYLTLAVKAYKIIAESKSDKKLEKVSEVVPLKSVVSPESINIYELDERDGSIIKLKDYKGLPSDDNYLNDRLAETNELFNKLQEIEKGWR